MTIKDGLDNKDTYITINSRSDLGRKAEFWINQTALEGIVTSKSETLSYITLDELLQLRDEINGVIQELVK